MVSSYLLLSEVPFHLEISGIFWNITTQVLEGRVFIFQISRSTVIYISWVKANYSSELNMAMLLSNLTLLMTLSLRAQYAIENVPINQLHGSSTTSDAQKELEFFFPEEQTFALIKPDAAKTHKGKAFRKYGLYLVM